jgi:1,4-alpha-glucan branching enzyme
VNAIEVMPAAEFPGSHSWGYHPAHQFAIERDYGGPKAFRRFIKAAHERGIAVILDVVYNHLGPTDIDLWQFDGWSDFGHSGGIYIYDDNRAHTPWGHTRPDYGRGEVRQYLRDNALFWLEEFQLDGLRIDATAYVRSVTGIGTDLPDGWGLMQWINDEVNARQPGKLMIAEDLRDDDWITRDTQHGGAGFDAQWSARFVLAVRHAIVTQEDRDRDMVAVANAIQQTFNHDASERVIYTESHDEVANGQARVADEIWPNYPDSWFSKKRSTLGAAVVLTSPGIPMILQGQEFLEDRWFADTDPLDWCRRERYAGIVRLYRDLIRLRRNWFNNTRGLSGDHVNVFHINNVDKVLAMHRWDQGGQGDDVVVVFNFSNRSFENYRVGFPLAGLWHLRANTDAEVYDVDFGDTPAFDCEAQPFSYDGHAYSGLVALPPYTALVFSR